MLKTISKNSLDLLFNSALKAGENTITVTGKFDTVTEITEKSEKITFDAIVTYIEKEDESAKNLLLILKLAGMEKINRGSNATVKYGGSTMLAKELYMKSLSIDGRTWKINGLLRIMYRFAGKNLREALDMGSWTYLRYRNPMISTTVRSTDLAKALVKTIFGVKENSGYKTVARKVSYGHGAELDMQAVYETVQTETGLSPVTLNLSDKEIYLALAQSRLNI
jgi:hypothetical protein